MNQKELQAYDHYPELSRSLIRWAGDCTRFPLEEMRSAVQRMSLTNAFIGPQDSQQIESGVLEDHEDLIELVMSFRDQYIELALKAGRQRE